MMGRVLLHVPIGAFNAWLFWHVPQVGVIFFVGFLIYELNEDWRIRDQAWRDIKGYLWGLAIAAVFLILLLGG